MSKSELFERIVLCFVGVLFVIKQAENVLPCSNVVTYHEMENEKSAEFQLELSKQPNNTYIEVTIFLTNLCKRQLCDLRMGETRKRVAHLYETGQPIPFGVRFLRESKEASIVGIGLRTTFGCELFCKEDITQESKFKSIKYVYFPKRDANSRQADCDLKELMSGSTKCGTISPTISYVDSNMEEDIPRGSWPWLVALYVEKRNRTKFVCGATLISDRFVLTAAHCLHSSYNYAPWQVSMLMGKHDITDSNEEGCHMYQTKRIFFHPNYKVGRIINRDADIALLLTKDEVRFTNFIRPACLWQTPETIAEISGQRGRVTGWGLLSTGEQSQFPKQVEVNIASHEECSRTYDGYTDILTSNNFCAANLNEAGPCKGDSGSALLIKKNNQWTVRGVVTGGLELSSECDLEKHIIYSDVKYYKDWIKSKMDSI